MGVTGLGIDANDVWFSYNGPQYVLRGINIRVEPNLVTMLLGPSGSGKSTLLKVVKGILPAQRGRVSVSPGNGASSQVAKRQVAYIPQNLGLVRSLTAMENALTGALWRMGTISSWFKVFPKDLVAEAEGVLSRFGLGSKQDRKVYELSGGERQRVAIARALMQKPRLILADEFVSQLDTTTAMGIMDIVKAISRDGVTFFIATHELDVVMTYGDKAMVLREGQIAMDEDVSSLTEDALAEMLK